MLLVVFEYGGEVYEGVLIDVRFDPGGDLGVQRLQAGQILALV